VVDARGDEVPPRGWETPCEPDATPGFSSLRDLLELAFARLPQDTRTALSQALRELLEALLDLLDAVRALIRWLLERLDHRTAAPAPARDIPVL